MNTMTITSAQYVNHMGQPSSIKATIEGEDFFVPLAPGNRHHDELMRQVEAGTLVIQEADAA
jgi:hypothetical protein